jgi:hypothetical protein
MRVWIPFFPAQHVNCGCLVTRTEHLSENTSSPRRRHRPPRHAARAHIVCTFFCIVALYLLSSITWTHDAHMAERNFSNISGAGSIVSKNARRSVGGLANPTTPDPPAPHADRVAIAPTRAGRRNPRTSPNYCVDIRLVPRRAVSGPKTARRTRTAPGGNALYREGTHVSIRTYPLRLDPEAPDTAADSASGDAEI